MSNDTADTGPSAGQPTHNLEVEHEQPQDNLTYPTGTILIATVSSLLVSLILLGLDLSIVATATPAITSHFRTIKDIGWYKAATSLVLVSFLFTFSKLYTLYSIKRVYIISLLIFELGCLICTVAWTSKIFILGRAVAGLGSSGLLQGVFTIIAQTVPLRKRALLGGIAGATETLASTCGPVLGGVLTDRFTWRTCFGINLPLGALALFGVAFFYQEQPRNNEDLHLPWKAKIRKLDLVSTAIFVPSMASLLLALQWGGITYGWRDPRIVVLFVVFALTLAAFAYLQYRQGSDTLLPPRIIKQRSILAGAWFAALCNASLAVVEFYLVVYFQSVKGYSAAKSGLFLMPQIVGLCISCLLAGFGTTMVGYYAPFMVVSTILGPIAAGLLTRIPLDAKLISILVYEALLGFGIGLGIQAPQVAAQTVLAAKDVPIGIGIISFAQIFGPTLFVPAAQAMFQTRLERELSQSPQLNVTNIENMGLSNIRDSLGGDKLRKVLLGYDDAVSETMYLPVALTCLTLLGTLGMEWRSVKKKQQ